MFTLPLNQKHRTILHVDADAFFASVEQVLDPTLKGKPIAVGGPSKSNGIVSAASYEARKYGVHSAMPLYLARRKCPNLIVVPGHFKAYREFSRRMYNIFMEFTPDVEMASIDEAYLNISGCEKMHKKSPEDIARTMLMKIHKDLGISVSCGLAINKTVAKVASSQNKPHKLTIVPFGREKSFLGPLPLRALPGIGPKTAAQLERFGLKKIEDLSGMKARDVIDKFGINAIPLWKRASGIDNSEIISTPVLPKSISKERTFYKENLNREQCLKVLKELSVIVLTKLRAYELKSKTIVLKIRYLEENRVDGAGRKPFMDFSFQKSLFRPGSIDCDIFPILKELFLENFNSTMPVRLLGFGVSNLVQQYNLNLFDPNPSGDGLFFSIDGIRKIYGEDALKYGV